MLYVLYRVLVRVLFSWGIRSGFPAECHIRDKEAMASWHVWAETARFYPDNLLKTTFLCIFVHSA